MPNKLGKKSPLLSKNEGAEKTSSKPQAGSDPILCFMQTHKIPLTREAYLGMAYPDHKPGALLPPELEAELPEQLRAK